MIRNRLATIAILATTGSMVLGLTGAKQAFAQTPLPPGTTLGVPVPTIVTGTPPFGDTLLRGLQAPVFATNGSDTISGLVTSAVFRNGSGFLDFLYQFSFDSNTTVIIDAISIASFEGVAGVSVAQTSEDVDGPGGLPAEDQGNVIQDNFTASSANTSFDTATRPSASGTAINSPLLTGVTGNQTSFTFIVRTQATDYSLLGSTSVQGGGISGFTLTPGTLAPLPVGPLAAAPEPTALSLLALGLVGTAAGVARRRRRS